MSTRPDADGELFAQMYLSLRRFAGVVRAPGLEPDDLLQEALVRVLAKTSLVQLDDAEAYLRVTILRLAANARRKAWRHHRAVQRLTVDSGRGDPSSGLQLDELFGLEPRDRAAVYLFVVEGRSHREIAGVLGWSEANSRARVSRALQRLRAALVEEARDA